MTQTSNKIKRCENLVIIASARNLNLSNKPSSSSSIWMYYPIGTHDENRQYCYFARLNGGAVRRIISHWNVECQFLF